MPESRKPGGTRFPGWLAWVVGGVVVALCAGVAASSMRGETETGAGGLQTSGADKTNSGEQVMPTSATSNYGTSGYDVKPGKDTTVDASNSGTSLEGVSATADQGVGGSRRASIDIEAVMRHLGDTGVSREDLLAAMSDSVPGSRGASSRQANYVDGLVKRSMRDPVFADGLLRQLTTNPAADERRLWGAALAITQPEALADALMKLTESPDAATRSAAYELIREAHLPDAQLAKLGNHLLATKPDADGVATGLAALRQFQLAIGEDSGVGDIDALVEYAYSPDPIVRAEGIASLVQKGKSSYLEPVLFSALADSDSRVQMAGIEGIINAELRTTGFKNELIRLSLDVNAEFEVRAFAINAIDHFSLTPEEQQLIAEVRNSLE